MKTQRIQINDYNTTFRAKLVDSGALRQFKSKLDVKNAKIFDSYVSTIEKSKDKHNYIFEYVNIYGKNGLRKLATISKQNKDKTVQHPPVFSENAESAMTVFKNLAEACKA